MHWKQSLGFIISATNTKMKNKLTKALQPYNVTQEQYSLLTKLWYRDGITQKELSEISLKDQPTTTRILDKLEKRGLILRQANPKDRRSFLIYLTNEGQKIKEPLTAIARQTLAESMHGLSEIEQSQLRTLLNRIMDNLD